MIAGRRECVRAGLALLLFCGIVLTIGLSAAPQLHDALHKTNAPHHQCAATQMSNGSWNQSTCDPILTAPQPGAVDQPFVSRDVRVIARAGTSILEHAPPANS